MARPQKAPQDRRSEQINIGLSPYELARVKCKADEANTTVTAFVRASALNKRLTVQQSDAPDFMTRHELRRIGVNLNQIAHALNAGLPHDQSALSAAITKLDDLFDKWLTHDPQSRTIGS